MGILTSFVDLITERRVPALPEMSRMTLAEETDVRGWTTGLVVDPRRNQVTVNMGLDTTGTVREAAWREWENKIAQTERMVATCTIDETGGAASSPRIATTFRAVSKAQRKDITELVTDVSLRQSGLYEQATQMRLPVRPLDAGHLAAAATAGLSGTTGGWDDLHEVDLQQDIEALVVNETRRMVAFSVDISRDDAAEQLDSIMEDWEDDTAMLRRTRFFRPYVLPEGTGEDMTTGTGRRWAIVTAIGQRGTLSEIADAALRGAFDGTPALGLSMRRMRGRQRTAVLAGLGVGVLGWQHIAAAERNPMATED